LQHGATNNGVKPRTVPTAGEDPDFRQSPPPLSFEAGLREGMSMLRGACLGAVSGPLPLLSFQ
jgi:hypothetical protein